MRGQHDVLPACAGALVNGVDELGEQGPYLFQRHPRGIIEEKRLEPCPVHPLHEELPVPGRACYPVHEDYHRLSLVVILEPEQEPLGVGHQTCRIVQARVPVAGVEKLVVQRRIDIIRRPHLDADPKDGLARVAVVHRYRRAFGHVVRIPLRRRDQHGRLSHQFIALEQAVPVHIGEHEEPVISGGQEQVIPFERIPNDRERHDLVLPVLAADRGQQQRSPALFKVVDPAVDQQEIAGSKALDQRHAGLVLERLPPGCLPGIETEVAAAGGRQNEGCQDQHGSGPERAGGATVHWYRGDGRKTVTHRIFFHSLPLK